MNNSIRTLIEKIETSTGTCLTQRTADKLNAKSRAKWQAKHSFNTQLARAAGLTPVNTTNLWS